MKEADRDDKVPNAWEAADPTVCPECGRDACDDHLPRGFTVLQGGRYRWKLPQYQTTFEADRLHWDRNELGGELIVRCALAGVPLDPDDPSSALSWSTFNFTSATTRNTLAKRLEARSGTGKDKKNPVPWDDLVERFCQKVLTAERTGTPAVCLADVPDPPVDALFSVGGLQIPKCVPSMIFGDGDSLKSTLALYLCGKLAQAGIPAAFFDWELNQAAQRKRYRQLFGQDLPRALIYCECSRAIVQEADRLTRIVGDRRIQFGVFDSVVPACGGKPEDAEMASGYFRAVRNIGGPAFTSLHVAHITKADGGDQKPFGSVFWSNLVRQSWFVKAVDKEDGQPDQTISLGFYPRKHNLSGRGVAVGFDVTFSDGRITIESADVQQQGGELARMLPLWARIQTALTTGPKTLAQLTDELDAKLNSIEQAISRRRHTFVKITNSPDGKHRIGLVDRRYRNGSGPDKAD